MNKSTNQDFIQIAHFFLNNFLVIKNINDIKSQFTSQIVDITEKKELQNPELLIMNHEFIGQTHYDFSFRDSRNYWGELSVDFLNGIFRNVRCQLFAEGLISNFFGLNQEYQKISRFLSEKCGKPAKFDRISIPGVNIIYWINEVDKLHITLSENKKQFPKMRRYISFGIEQI